LPDGTPVGVVEVGWGAGLTRTFELPAGQHTAEGLHGPLEGNDYVTRLQWQEPAVPTTIVVRATLPEGELVVRGVSLIDERTGSFQSLVLSDQGRFRLAHSGDVKIYENLDVLDRAFLVHRGAMAADDEAALAMMRDVSFDPTAEVILSEVEGSGAEGAVVAGDVAPVTVEERARVTHYAPERVEIEVTVEAPGYLVLTDAWYPGWEATVDSVPVPIYRADLLFRAVAVRAGNHRVVFAFRPVSLRVGAGVSLAGLVGLGVVAALALSKARRDAIMGGVVGQNSQEGK
jgi:hypothetical protein